MSVDTGTDLLGGEVAAPQKKTRLGHKQLEYAERYGYSVRQIKNWLAKGRELNRIPPLENPADMPTWFEEAYGRKCPMKLWTAVEGLKGEGEGESDSGLQPMDLPDLSGAVFSLEKQLRETHEDRASSRWLYQEALKKGDSGKANFYLKQTRELSGEIRQLEKQVEVAREKNRDLIPAVEVKNEVTGMLMALYRQLIAGGSKFRDDFSEPLEAAEFDSVWREKINSVFAACAASEFAEPFELKE